ncbi:MAG: DUF3343 domain-containing protein [Dehalococcoidia bacterium]|nr:DUF3343 domain-containing protein [Dehalococcoidia bacterium]
MTAVFLFHTSSAVFRAEKALKEARVPARLIPTPRQFSSDCGIALSIDAQYAEAAQTVLDKAGVEYAALHRMAP